MKIFKVFLTMYYMSWELSYLYGNSQLGSLFVVDVGVLVCFSIVYKMKKIEIKKTIESLSRRRFCQHGRQPEVNRAVIDGE